jgi:hypothetical protein
LAVAEGLPAPIRSQIVEGPDRFEAFVASLILGYGSAKGISAQGLEDHLAVERAKLRVRELRRLMLADLDDDGHVTQQELFVVMSAQGASARGSLWQAHSAADTDADGTVTQAELQARARLVAARSAADEATVRDLMTLDFDGDGFVSTLELRHALTLFAPKT